MIKIIHKKTLPILLSSFFLFFCSQSETYKPIFQFIYMGNINGNLEACHCSEPPLGGLDNIASIIESKRQDNPEIIVVDGGDIFNAYPFIQLNKRVAAAYKIINPEIIAPGEQDFTEGINFFNTFAGESRSILLGNAGVKGLTTIVRKSYHIKDMKRVTFSSYLEPSLIDSLTGTFSLPDQFNREKSSLKEKDFNILIYHGSEEFYNENTSEFELYNLILSAHNQNGLIDTLNTPFQVNAGADGEALLDITILNSESSYKIKVNRIDILKTENPNMQIKNLIDEYNTIINEL